MNREEKRKAHKAISKAKISHATGKPFSPEAKAEAHRIVDEAAVQPEGTTEEERAVDREGTESSERAGSQEGTERHERAAQAEGTGEPERAEEHEGTGRSERAVRAESPVTDERAAIREGTARQERAECPVSTEPVERAVSNESAEDAERVPALGTAADLLPSEEEVPPEPGPPIPGDRHGPFIVQRQPGYGDGWRDLIMRGEFIEPVGVWVAREHPDMPGPALAEMLVTMGLPQARAVTYGRQRQGRDAMDISAHPAVVTLVENEERHRKLKDEFARAYVAARKKDK